MQLFTFLLSALVTGALGQSTFRVLIFTATTGFRHDSIPTAVDALQKRGSTINTVFDHTEDGAKFTDKNLAQYNGIMFLSATGTDILDDAGKAAFQNFLDKGGSFIGVHAASACLNDTFYVRELGASFDYHPEISNATVNVIGPAHPSTAKLPPAWKVIDEMYNFDSDPRLLGAVVVLSADESTYADMGTKHEQGTPHPTAWYQEKGAGASANGTPARSFYTSLGHRNESWQDDLFMSHVLGGVSWAINSVPDTPSPTNLTGNIGGVTSPSPSPSPSPSAVRTSGALGLVAFSGIMHILLPTRILVSLIFF